MKPASTPTALRTGYFPFEYFQDFLQFLHQHRDVIKIITYQDLCWENDWDYQNNYANEWSCWKDGLRCGTIDPDKIYVLLQHDVDRLPERTMAVLRAEARLGLRSNVMIFWQRISRRHFQQTGELLYSPYPLDFSYLRHLQDEHKFVFGYHVNAFERAHFDVPQALQIFRQDVAALRRYLRIEFCSAHGGPKSPEGRSNNSLALPRELSKELRWVANGHSPSFNGAYSDGGLNSPHRDPTRRDLRDFVRTWQPGRRYRVLTHPQYYYSPCQLSPRLQGTAWYQELLACYCQPRPTNAWQDVHLQIGKQDE